MWTDDCWHRSELSRHRQVPLGASPTRELVAGAVALWGSIQVHPTGMRGQCARIVALALPITRGRKALDLAIAAGELGIELVPHRHLLATAMWHGTPVPRALTPAPQRTPAEIATQPATPGT